MNEELISFETAKLAKEKGFDIKCAYWYGCDNPSGDTKPNTLMCTPYRITELDGSRYTQEYTMVYSAPTQSLLQKWLREEYNLNVQITEYYRWTYTVSKLYNKNSINEEITEEETDTFYSDHRCGNIIVLPYGKKYKTYEEALEVGLLEALKLIRND